MKKGFRVPNTYTLIVMFMIFAAILTYLIPAGTYDLMKDENTGRKVINAESFHKVEQKPVGVESFLLSLPKGMNGVASMIFLVFLVGGFFQVVNDTGAIDAGINKVIDKFGKNSNLVIPLIMVALYIMGMLGILVNAVIAFIPIGIALAKKLKADPLVGVAVMYIGAFSGFTSSPVGPFNTLLAQNIVGLTPMSGFLLRLIVSLAILLVSMFFVMRYTMKIQKDISKSKLGDFNWEEYDSDQKEVDFKLPQALVLIVLVLGFGIYAYGTYKFKWSLAYLSAMMFLVGILSGIITKMHPDDMAKSFIKGAQRMVYGALVMGFANSIIIILKEGEIIHSIIHYMTIPLKHVAPVFSAVGMFFANLIFNLIVPSGSGQAVIVMPIMAPLSEVVGVTKQVAVSAYQYGDGFSNIIIPTSGVLMAILGLAKIPYEKWVKFITPLFLSWVAIGTASIIVAVMIGWS